MAKYHILSIPCIINTFSLIGSGNEFGYTYDYNEDKEAFKNIEVGDKILGYLGQPINEVRYSFYIKEVNQSNKVLLVKQFEVSTGLNIDSISEDIRERILNEGEEGDLLEISKNQYFDIINMISLSNEVIKDHEDDEIDDFILDKEITAPQLPFPHNYIVFGAPGTGKSYTLKKAQKNYFTYDEASERVTFYSNYSYQNFVGTYKPKMDGKDIKYEYTPGPFIRTLIKAYNNPGKNYLILIEEINRANPAAAFGDIFQLLDRKDGRSEYDIETTEDLREYLATHLIHGYKDSSNAELKQKALKRFSKIFIPRNMYIWATMNSADQGVFPMDTAFKRRWDFEYIGIDDNKGEMQDVIVQLGDDKHKVRWNDLREKINSILCDKCKLNEDKLLGPYFISKSVIEADEVTHIINDNEKFLKAFESKVIMYLYEDAAKQKSSTIFAGCSDISTYSKVCAEFRKKGEAIFEKDLSLEFKDPTDGE